MLPWTSGVTDGWATKHVQTRSLSAAKLVGVFGTHAPENGNGGPRDDEPPGGWWTMSRVEGAGIPKLDPCIQGRDIMRYLLVALLTLLIMTWRVMASPGGLDYRGGHHCWTNCSAYSLYYGQYHCHRAPCNWDDIQEHRAHGH